mmetsp:Transcript_86835/g.219009  ORF Transcript_86835/g.219009 Transcript_86835/m.219009 type:complete len:407 (+) Transcript_86835:105-1325(+)
MSGGRKVFVGSLPDGVEEGTLRTEFAKFGHVEDIFVKPGCEPGRQWAMVTYSTAQQAQMAKEATDRILQLPGGDRPVEVMIARNQSKVEPSSDPTSPTPVVAAPQQAAAAGPPRKIFVGSLPDSITENALREEFSKYGQISDIFLKSGCERHKQWAFITFTSAGEAEAAKANTDRQLKFPDSELACEVMLARNQGMNGRDPLRPVLQQPTNSTAQGPTKIFVGSLPDHITETVLRAEFSRYGQITDVFMKTGCESHKQWAFVIFATHAQAQHAKDSTDRVLMVPGASNPCEVMFAKFQGKNGQEPLQQRGGSGGGGGSMGGIPAPPPMSQMPPQYAWRVYQTPQGLTYYHNHLTNVTQWECPMELQYAQMATQQSQAAQMQQMQQPASMYGAMYMPQHAAPMYRPY